MLFLLKPTTAGAAAAARSCWPMLLLLLTMLFIHALDAVAVVSAAICTVYAEYESDKLYYVRICNISSDAWCNVVIVLVFYKLVFK